MINIKNNKHGVIFSNTLSLVSLQLVNYIVPFLLTPYLVRILTPNIFGVVSFGLSIVQIASIFTDYGFNLSATYSISQQKNNKESINYIIGAVILCKVCLLFLMIIFIFLYIKLETKYTNYHMYFYYLIFSIVGQTFQPIWFFQGIEKMKNITYYSIISKIIYFVLIFLLVKSQNDIIWVAKANGISSCTGALVGLTIMIRLGYFPKWPGVEFVKKTFIKSSDFFLSRASVAIYTSGSIFFLGIVSGPIQVSYFSCAEQLYRGCQAMLNPLSQVMFPYMTRTKNIVNFYKFLRIALLVCIIGSILGVLIGEWAIIKIYGIKLINSYSILVVFLLTLIITTPSIMVGYPLLGAFGLNKLVNRSVIIAGGFQILLLALCYLFRYTSGFNVAISIFLTETFVLVLRLKWLKENHLLRLNY